jgi:hypothetical protein
MFRAMLRWPFLFALSLSSAIAGSRLAYAEETIAFEPRASFIVPKSPYPGAGLAVNAGISLDLEPIIVIPELSVVGDGFPSLPGGTFRAMAGVRAGLAGPVEPTIFLHVGYGFLGIKPGLTHGFSLDTGFALDYRPTRVFTVGGMLGYELLANGNGAIHGAFIGPRFAVWIN